jgi:hypothetical protein
VSAGRSYKTPRSKLPDCPADVGGVTEWLMVADCKSAGLTPYVGSNPTPTMEAGQRRRGCSSVGRASAFQAEGRGFESRRPLSWGRADALTHIRGT